MVIQTLTTNYNKLYGEKPLRILIWHSRKHLSVFPTTLCNRHKDSSFCNSQADLGPKFETVSVESEGAWDTSDPIRRGGLRTVHGV